MTNTESNINPQNLTDGQKLAATTAITLPPNYSYKFGNKGLDTFAHVSTADFTPVGARGAIYKSDNSVTITLNNAYISGVTPITLQTFDYLVLRLTKQLTKGEQDLNRLEKQRVIDISLDDYADSRGLKQKAAAWNQLKTECDSLRGVSMNWEQEIKGFKHVVKVTAISTVEEIGNRHIKVYFNLDAVRLFTSGRISPYFMPALQIRSNKNPNAYYICQRLMEHYNLNHGKKNAQSISVKTLIEACPDLRDTVEKQGAHKHKSRIREYLKRDLDSLTKPKGEFLNEWYYLHAHGQKLTDDELTKDIFFYDKWQELYIHFELLTPPDYPKPKRKKTADKKGGKAQKTAQSKTTDK